MPFELTQAIERVNSIDDELLHAFGLKDRENFLHLFLNPAIGEGLVKLLYPEKPQHPRQKYLLTVKGLTLYQELREAKFVKENDT